MLQVLSLRWEDPWRRKCNPLQYSGLENLMHRGAWWATVHGVPKESDMTEHEILDVNIIHCPLEIFIMWHPEIVRSETEAPTSYLCLTFLDPIKLSTRSNPSSLHSLSALWARASITPCLHHCSIQQPRTCIPHFIPQGWLSCRVCLPVVEGGCCPVMTLTLPLPSINLGTRLCSPLEEWAHFQNVPVPWCVLLLLPCVWVCVLSPVQLFVTLWTVAHQASLSVGFPGQES